MFFFFLLLPSCFLLLPSYFFLLLTSSYFLLLTSYFLLLTSYFLLLTSYVVLLTSYFLRRTSYFVLLLELKIGSAGKRRAPKSLRDHQKGAQGSSKTLLRQSSAARIEKKRPKRDPREPKERRGQSVSALLGRSGSPKGPQETPKSAQEEPKRAPKRSQDHLPIKNLDFSKIFERLSSNQGF